MPVTLQTYGLRGKYTSNALTTTNVTKRLEFCLKPLADDRNMSCPRLRGEESFVGVDFLFK